MPGTRFLKLQTALITALTLMTGYPVGPGVSAESLPPALPVINVSKLVINIPSRTLWVYSKDRIVRYFPVGVGRPGYMTPVGKFKVIRKVIDPGWENPYLPEGQVRLAPGEENPLGTRWIGFYQKDGGEYGIHGTDMPSSVGKFSSHGCVRMKVPDAEALFEMVDIGTPLEVVYQPVLIRQNGNQIRVIVFADRFRKGMPSVEKVLRDIRRQYPNAVVNVEKLKVALRQPTERPVDVGVMPTEETTAQEGKKLDLDNLPELKPMESMNSLQKSFD